MCGVNMTIPFPFFYSPHSSLARATAKILLHLLENISFYVHTHKFSFLLHLCIHKCVSLCIYTYTYVHRHIHLYKYIHTIHTHTHFKKSTELSSIKALYYLFSTSEVWKVLELEVLGRNSRTYYISFCKCTSKCMFRSSSSLIRAFYLKN